MHRLFYTLCFVILWAVAPAGYATGIVAGQTGAPGVYSGIYYATQAQAQPSENAKAPAVCEGSTHTLVFSVQKPPYPSHSLAERVGIEDDAPTEELLVSAPRSPYGGLGLLDEKLGSVNDANGPPARLFLSQCKLRL